MHRGIRARSEDDEDVHMPDTASSANIAGLSDTKILELYLSLPPTARERVFVDTCQAARLTGVSMRTIQLWIESGAIRAIAIGRKYRVVLDSLRAHLKRQMHKRV
jgi:excisionase family DNA binding protein